ncbi:hypothetical protein [Brevundimonas sp. Root1423]|uniref:hypothetical protein n=1 Tax=Brevundimonas sp. Root1423 TaxID=1736462 RepID=UPI0006FF2D92|nr:hypothetical protein [Brevundimonas sp. Root1423]KQY75298.1 hypothetical protein ASD25_12200 [Brevundimonas sp. Root1423]
MLITALLMAGALMTGDPDGVVATAPATPVDLGATVRPDAPSVVGAAQAGVPHNLTTAEQIDRWIAARPAEDRPYDRPRGESLDDGLPHGEVSVSVGTGGYRDYGAAVSLPIGEHGRLDLSYRQVENGYPYGGYGYGYGDGYTLGRGQGGAMFDNSGYVFPGYRPGAAAEFESRAVRPDGPPDRRPRVQPLRTAP